MARHDRIDGFNVEVMEEIFFELGEATDWLIRKEQAMQDLLDKLEQGKITFVAARLAVCLDYAEGHKNLHECESRLAGAAQKAGFPYLHSDLQQTLKFPAFRVILPMRDGEAPA